MRPDQEIIQRWITKDSRVLDLGCGDGTLLENIRQTKNVRGIGLEIDADKIQRCVERGINVIEQDLDKGLSIFSPTVSTPCCSRRRCRHSATQTS